MRWLTRRDDPEPAVDLAAVRETNKELRRVAALMKEAQRRLTDSLEALRRTEQG